MAAAMIQHSPNATAPANIAAATFRSCATSFHTSNRASLLATAKATKNTTIPSVAKINPLSAGISVIASLYEDCARGCNS